MSAIARALRTIFALGALYAVAVVLGLGLLVLAFRLGVLASIDILFYRGLVIIAGVAGLVFVGLALALRRRRPWGLQPRDALAAAVLSLSVNLSFLIVAPVTVDRSISIFVLGQMAADPEATFTPDAMSALFARVYVGDYHQIDRRLHEQAVSGNVEPVGNNAYRITARGRSVIEVSRVIAALFDSHAGLIPPRGNTTADRHATAR